MKDDPIVDEVRRAGEAYLAQLRAPNGKLGSQVAELNRQLQEQQALAEGIVGPVRQRLLAELKPAVQGGGIAAPRPIARWDFSTGLRDTIGSLHGESRRGARLEEGALVVNQKGHLITAPITQSLREKTLEAWVRLDTLDQRGGGVITLQTPSGSVFDAIVFGEKNAGQWMAGSNFFKRTQSFNAPVEREATSRPVQIAIAYHADGIIAAYRDGAPYGTPYKSDGPVEFKAGEAVVGFGIRHLPGAENAFLSGRILRAELYDRALTGDEVRLSLLAGPKFVSDADILAGLPEADRQQVVRAQAQIADLQAQIERLGPVPDISEKAVWTDVARAMFTFKEFIYLK